MHTLWRTLLESEGATLDGNAAVRFQNNEPFPKYAICDLSHLGLLQVSGSDAVDFLHGQLTNDIRAVDPETSQLSAHCTPQGRVVANFRIIPREDYFLLQMPVSILPLLKERLERYVLRSKVELSAVSEELISIGLIGFPPTKDCWPNEIITLDLPKKEGQVSHNGPFTALALPGNPVRFTLIAPPSDMERLWHLLRTHYPLANGDFWTLQEIRCGIPTVYSATTESFIPQMINMDLIDGISFTKGCYVGQEVVARTNYLGKVKRRMHLAWTDTTQRPEPGDELINSASAQSGQWIGKIVDAAPSPEGGFELLATIEQEAATSKEEVRLQRDTEARLHVRKLPYPMEL